MIVIAKTDFDWFQQLRADGSRSGKINYWTPTPWNPKRLKRNVNFYFMLKSPIEKIGGYGKFVEYKNMRASEAWEKYGRDNGVQDKTGLISRIRKYATKHSRHPVLPNPEIGCILLSEPIFFDDVDFITDKSLDVSFSKHNVKLQYFDKHKKIVVSSLKRKKFVLVDPSKGKTKISTKKERKGQANFRKDILHVYENTCTITGIRQKETLEAAHIQPYINEESNHVENGLCLRADVHKLFDNGLISIDENHRVIVSNLLETETYRKLNGRAIKLPRQKYNYPSIEALRYHYDFVFRK